MVFESKWNEADQPFDVADLSVTTDGQYVLSDAQLAQRLQASESPIAAPRTSSPAITKRACQRVAQVLAVAQKSGVLEPGFVTDLGCGRCRSDSERVEYACRHPYDVPAAGRTGFGQTLAVWLGIRPCSC